MSRHLHAGANYLCVSLALTGGAIILLVSVIVSNVKQNEDVLKSCEKQADVQVTVSLSISPCLWPVWAVSGHYL